MFFDKFSSYLGYISEEHNEEPWFLDVLKLWSHQSKHDQAIEQDCEPVVGEDHLHDQGRPDPVDLLEMVVAVEQRQTSYKRHHHQLHRGPGRLGSLVLVLTGLGRVEDLLTIPITVFAPNREDTDKKGQGGHNDLPRLGRTKLPVASKNFSNPGG